MTYERVRKFAFFMLGVAVPVAALITWRKRDGSRKQRIDHVRDLAIEESFPASDPPASW